MTQFLGWFGGSARDHSSRQKPTALEASGQTMNSFRQRREKILATIFEKRHVSARDLAVELPASEATVRRDLRAMAAAGEIELVYGGATLRRPSDYSFRSKGKRNVEAKQIVGCLAAGLGRGEWQ